MPTHLGLKLHEPVIDRLPTSLKAGLAAACTQRQAEAYRVHQRRIGRSAKEFDALLECIWRDARSPRASEQEHKQWEAAAENLIRIKNDSSIADDMYDDSVEYALLSLLYTNDVLMNGKTEYALYAANQAFESIQEYLIGSICKTPEIDFYDPNEFQKVMAHPLTRAEHQRQERDLFEVEQAVLRGEGVPSIVERLRKRAELEAHSFIPIFERASA
jgi:hypothetical protein